MCIGINELLRNRKPCLKLPNLKVGIRCLGSDGDSSPDLIGLRSLEFISGRSFAAAQPSGQIDFPARRGSNRILSLIAFVAWNTIRSRTERIRNALVHGCTRRLQISCRQKLRARRCCCRSGLADTCKRSGKIKILVQGALHDSHEHWVVEPHPPTVQRRCRKFWLCRADGGEIMKWSEIGGGVHITWTHGTTTCKKAEGKNDRCRFERGLTQFAFLTVTAEIADESVKRWREQKTEDGYSDHAEQDGSSQGLAHLRSCSVRDGKRSNAEDEGERCHQNRA